MLVINPPSAFDERLSLVLEELQQALSKGEYCCAASTSLHWLTENGSRRVMLGGDCTLASSDSFPGKNIRMYSSVLKKFSLSLSLSLYLSLVTKSSYAHHEAEASAGTERALRLQTRPLAAPCHHGSVWLHVAILYSHMVAVLCKLGFRWTCIHFWRLDLELFLVLLACFSSRG